MSFDELLRAAWADHATDAEGVAARLPAGLALMATPADASAFAHLAVHVLGEHLGRWDDGLRLLARVRGVAAAADPEAAAALDRGEASLRYCAGEGDVGTFGPSDRARVLATAAGALCGQGRLDAAAQAFRRALDLAGDAGRGDPAARALAVTANNLACALEERPRSAAETDFMVEAARAARRFWAVAGGWREVERAEYRLARSLTSAGRAAEALPHARACLDQCRAHDAAPLELFFAHEALAWAAHAAGDATARDSLRAAADALARLDADDAAWCRPSLDRLEAALGQ